MGSDHVDDCRFGCCHLVGRWTGAVGCLRTSHYPRDWILALSERGSAPAEFVLVSALLVTMVLGLMQVILLSHVRHTLVSAAAEGARQASLVDVSAAHALQVTRNLIRASLSDRYAEDVNLYHSEELGIPTVLVTIRAPFPALGLWSVGGEMVVSAHAPLERVR
jgi:Flp pilus assembly protein TadG